MVELACLVDSVRVRIMVVWKKKCAHREGPLPLTIKREFVHQRPWLKKSNLEVVTADRNH